MRVLLVQPHIEFAKFQENIKTCNCLVKKALDGAEVDLIVLPEMFSTGTCSSPEKIAGASESALSFMKLLATEHDCAVCGSIAVEENARFFNRLYFVTPETVFYYDKRHLFSYSGENKRFTAGDKRVVVEWRDWKFLLQVCYDLRFPVFSRNYDGDLGYDAAIYVASWPNSRIKVWDTLLKARAIENQCFTIGVNAAGEIEDTEQRLYYSGHSAVINYKGEIVTACSTEGKEDARIAQIDKNELLAFKEKFPTLPDGD